MHEMAYTDFVSSGGAAEFCDKLRNDDDFEEPEEGWSIAQNEVYLHDWCSDLYETETMAYEKLRDLQGTQIPRLFAQVRLSIKPTDIEEYVGADFFEVKGILLELIPGSALEQLADAIPQESWQPVVDEAIEIVHELSNHDVLNKDVRASNIVASPIGDKEHRYRVVMLDFAQCRFRGNDESDLDWGRAKWSQDEEGAIGLVMQSRLKKRGYDLNYIPSRRFAQWVERESHECERVRGFWTTLYQFICIPSIP
jgi:hypothetical protein